MWCTTRSPCRTGSSPALATFSSLSSDINVVLQDWYVVGFNLRQKSAPTEQNWAFGDHKCMSCMCHTSSHNIATTTFNHYHHHCHTLLLASSSHHLRCHIHTHSLVAQLARRRITTIIIIVCVLSSVTSICPVGQVFVMRVTHDDHRGRFVVQDNQNKLARRMITTIIIKMIDFKMIRFV